MNQEENKTVTSTTGEASTAVNSTLNASDNRMLAGSPGIVIAPVTEGARDASEADKGRVNVATNNTGVATPNPVQQTKAPLINPTVVTPRVEVT